MFYEKQTATGILTATTSRSFRHFGDKESVVVTFASAADSFRGVSDADDKQHILRVLREAVGQSADSYNSLTLTAMERGVAYPVVGMKFDRTVTIRNGRTGSPSTSERTERPDLHFKRVFDPDVVLHRGLYTEVDRIEETVRLISKPPEPEAKAYLMIGFKSNKASPERMLEASWKEWTGARNLYLNLADEFCLSTIRFFQRIEPEAVDMFQYIALAELDNVNERNRNKMMDFVHRMRLNRLHAHTSLYRVAPARSATTPKTHKGGTLWPKFDSSYDSQDSGESSTAESLRFLSMEDGYQRFSSTI